MPGNINLRAPQHVHNHNTTNTIYEINLTHQTMGLPSSLLKKNNGPFIICYYLEVSHHSRQYLMHLRKDKFKSSIVSLGY